MFIFVYNNLTTEELPLLLKSFTSCLNSFLSLITCIGGGGGNKKDV